MKLFESSFAQEGQLQVKTLLLWSCKHGRGSPYLVSIVTWHWISPIINYVRVVCNQTKQSGGSVYPWVQHWMASRAKCCITTLTWVPHLVVGIDTRLPSSVYDHSSQLWKTCIERNMAPLSEAINVKFDRTLDDGTSVYTSILDPKWTVARSVFTTWNISRALQIRWIQ